MKANRGDQQDSATIDLSGRFNEMIQRCNSLLVLSMKLKARSPLEYDTSEITIDDVVRATVVLLHATTEELMRSVLFRHLRLQPEKAYKNYGQGNRFASIFAPWLAIRDSDDPDAEVIANSVVDDLLHEITFNRIKQVKEALDVLGVHSAAKESFYTLLEKLFERRHQIAHSADHKNIRRSNLDSIDSVSVQKWIDNVEGFGRFLIGTDRMNVLNVALRP